MTKAFSSVEWLAQSSQKPYREQKKKVEYQYSPYPIPAFSSWSNHESSCPSSVQTSPCSSDSELSLYSNEDRPSFQDKDLEPSVTGLFQSETTEFNTIFSGTESRPTKSPTASIFKVTSSNDDSTQPGCNSSTDSEYESEASHSSSAAPEGDAVETSSNSSDEESKIGRRLRTAFTSNQISTLEKTFQKHKYLGASERRKLVAKLQLSEVQIKTWFQNRRMKLKREIQEGRPNSAQFCSVYGYLQQPIPAYQYIVKHPYPAHPLMDTMNASIPYTMKTPLMDSVNTFNSPPYQMVYLHQHSLAHGYHGERPFVRY